MPRRSSPAPKRLVVVVWKDIISRADWAGEIDEILGDIEPILCLTVGWIIRDDDETLTLADSATRDKTYGGLTSIPKSVVVEVDELRKESPIDILNKAHRKYKKRRKTK